jgi:hypothetical protein
LANAVHSNSAIIALRSGAVQFFGKIAVDFDRPFASVARGD